MRLPNLVRIWGLLLPILLMFGCGTPCPMDTKVENLSSARIKELSEKIKGMDVEQRQAFLKRLQVASKFVPKQLFIKFTEKSDESKIKSILDTLGSSTLYQFQTNKTLLVDIPSAITEADLLGAASALSEVQSVEYVHPNSILKIVTAPNDPLYSQQADLNNDGINGKKRGADIDAPEAWQVTTGSSSVVVGIIDTGIDYTHPDLKDNIWTNPGETGLDSQGRDKRNNGVDDDGNGYVDDFRGWDFVNNDNDPMDDNRHGTHVAGTIGAVGNNGVGIAGINWEVRMVGLKFLSGSGSGQLSDAVKAIEYATMMNIPITSNSWGGGGYEATLEAAIKAAGDKGFLFVAAAGNDSNNNDVTPSYPASYSLPNIISVAAVDSDDTLAYFSNFGASSVHVAAPGVNILSTLPNNSYGLLSGTSMACPHVTGVAALIKSHSPESDYRKIKDRIVGSADRVSTLAGKVASGRLNAAAAFEEDTILPNPVTDAAISFLGITRFEVEWSASGDDGAAGTASSYQIRMSDEAIDSEAKWQRATQPSIIMLAQSARLKARVVDLPLKSKGFIAIRAIDNVGNMSALEISLPFQLLEAEQLFVNNGESFEGIRMVPDASWGLEEVESRGNVLSDSPKTTYSNNEDTSIELPPVTVVQSDLLLAFASKLSCESGGDWAFIEYKKNDESTWTELTSYSAENCNWANLRFQLGDKVVSNDILKIRFRLKSDNSINADGWLIDDIKVLGVPNQTIPGAPTELVAQAEFKKVLLSWKAPTDDGRSPISDYIIRYSMDEGRNWILANDAVSVETSATIPDLNPATREFAGYLFQVAAVNGKGKGEYITTSEIVAPLSLPDAPTGLIAEGLLNSARLQWNVPFSGGKPITQYVVRSSSDNGIQWSAILTSGPEAVITFPNLNPSQSYIFQVAAKTEVGMSLFSESSQRVTPYSLPGNPVELRATPGNTQVALSWSAPAQDGGNFIRDYVLQYSSDEGASWVTYSDGESPSLSAVVTGLINGNRYFFKVAAVNSGGMGLFSSSVWTTPLTTPGAPTSVTGTRGNGQLTLNWVAPASNGGSAVTDYIVQYSSDGGTNFTTFNDGVSTSLRATVTGLTNGTSYVFKVAAVNVVGTGSYSSNSAPVVPAGPPGAPTSVVATAGNGQAILTWAAPANDGGSPITNYAYRRSSDNGTTWSGRVFLSTSDLGTYTVTGLVNGTSYLFQVAAVNGVETGSYSSNSAAVVPAGPPGSPTSVTGIAGDGQVSLNWDAPASTGGSAITDYIVRYSSNGGANFTTFNDGVSTALSATVTGLTNGTSYVFQVVAVNVAGQGSPSANSNSVTPFQPVFISTWKTDNTNAGSSANNQVALPLDSGGSYDFSVDWGDGTSSTIKSGTDSAKKHTYARPGTYRLSIKGIITGFRFDNKGDTLKLINISSFGPLRLGNNGSYFSGALNLTITAMDPLDLTGTTNLFSAFQLCQSLTTVPSMTKWDTRNVTNMALMFASADKFNQDIGKWNTSNVTNMAAMFRYARAFSQNIGLWNVAKVTDMSEMFKGAFAFNQNIGSWNTSNVTNMSWLFSSSIFNRPIGNWNTSKVAKMESMFSYNSYFNQDIGSWNTSNVNTMANMFNEATSFNQNIGGWNTGKVTNMWRLFMGASSFNQDIGAWNTAKVTNMERMFANTRFNRPLSQWNTSSVTNMSWMFSENPMFNQPIGKWNTAKVSNMSYMFYRATAFNQNLGSWKVGQAQAMTAMFSSAGLSRDNYDAILLGWSDQDLQPGVTLDAGAIKYSSTTQVIAARSKLTSNRWAGGKQWRVNDGGAEVRLPASSRTSP